MDVLAFEEAARHYERAFGLLDAGGGAQATARSEVLVALADAQYRAGEEAKSEGTLGQAIEAARTAGDALALDEASRLLASRFPGSP